MKRILEIIGFTTDGCTRAQAAGADRIELCDNPHEGGTTPSAGFITAARKILRIPVYVMIRPRGGDFHYSQQEFNIMLSDIQYCKQAGCDGVVAGILTEEGCVDKKRTAILADCAYPMGVTFHRAFDRCADAFKAVDDIIETGCERILTSGQQRTALQGATLIRELISKADDRIVIMPGSGISSSNISDLLLQTGAAEFHASAKMEQSGSMRYYNAQLESSSSFISVNQQEVRMMKELINGEA